MKLNIEIIDTGNLYKEKCNFTIAFCPNTSYYSIHVIFDVNGLYKFLCFNCLTKSLQKWLSDYYEAMLIPHTPIHHTAADINSIVIIINGMCVWG